MKLPFDSFSAVQVHYLSILEKAEVAIWLHTVSLEFMWLRTFVNICENRF